MTYAPRTTRSRWLRDAILALLRETDRPLTSGEIGGYIGYELLWPTSSTSRHYWCDACRLHHEPPVRRRLGGYEVRGVLTTMLKHGEVASVAAGPARRGMTPLWSLGPNAPEPVELTGIDLDSLAP